jgi:hypothetical protein
MLNNGLLLVLLMEIQNLWRLWSSIVNVRDYKMSIIITNFMGHNLTIIVMQILIFIGSYKIDMNVIHLLVLFEHQCYVHYLDTNVKCMFILFKHECCVSIHIVYTWKSCTWLPCFNNAWHSCVNGTNPWSL